MPPEFAKDTLAALLTAMLVWAAVSDIITRRIPNATVIAVLVLYIPWAVLHWGDVALWGLAGGAIALAIGIGLYVFSVVGAGDAKLFASVALFVGLGHLIAFGAATAIVGGVIAIMSLSVQPHRAVAMFMLRGKGDFGRGIPYGVAISIAGALVVWAQLVKPPILEGLGL